MTFETPGLSDLLALLLSAVLRLFGADMVDCHQMSEAWPADMDEEAIRDAVDLSPCGIVFRGGALWLLPDSRRKLQFNDDLVGLDTMPSVHADWLPDGAVWGAYWVHRSGAVRKTHIYDNGPDFFQRGLARYIDARGKFGLVDRRLRIAIPAAFDFAFPFDEPRAQVCNGCVWEPCDHVDCEQSRSLVGGHWGSVDRHGRVQWRPAR